MNGHVTTEAGNSWPEVGMRTDQEVHSDMSRDVRKPVFGVSDQIRHKPATEDGLRLEISDMESRGSGENKGADQLRGFHEADLRLCFQRCKDPVFSRSSSYLHDRRAVNV